LLSSNLSSSQESPTTGGGPLDFLESVYNSKVFLVIQIIIALYCLVLVFNIIYTSFQLSLFRGRARQFFTGAKAKREEYEALEMMPGTMRILEVNKKIASDVPSNWKIGVIEADKILDRTLEQKGFAGESLGEKLKQMVPADLPEVYEEVWEAHKIRNKIVHEPDFEITQSEARKLAGIYERAIKRIL